MTTGSSTFAGLSAFAGSFAFASPFASASFILFSPSASPLLPVVHDIIKPFYIRKSVTSIDNTTTLKTLKSII